MSLLFKINDKSKIVLDKTALKLCPKLKLLTDQQIVYIVLAYDYHSKYRQFPSDQRKDKSRYEIFGPKADDPELNKNMKEAIAEYKGLQYDSRRETINIYNDKAASLRIRMEALEEYGDINNTMKSIDLFEKKMRDIQNEIDSDFKAPELEGGGRLSLLETLQGNLDRFKRDIKEKVSS